MKAKWLCCLFLVVGGCIWLTIVTLKTDIWKISRQPTPSPKWLYPRMYPTSTPTPTLTVAPKVDLSPRWCNTTKSFKDGNGMKKRQLPSAIIIGAKKCGTSSLLEMLRSHPFVDGPSFETYFFSFSKRYKRGLEWYKRIMPSTGPDQITIEKTPGYFTSHTALENLYTHSLNHSIKFILILREPVLRSVSDYAWRLSYYGRRGKNVSSYEHYVFTDSIQGQKATKISTKPSEINVSLYDVHYKRWLEKFSREKIHIVNGDELVRNPVPELHKIETFLNIPHYFSDKIFSFSATKGFYCWRRFNNRHQCTEPNVKCMDSRNGRKHPIVSPQSLEKVKTFLNPHIQNFCKSIITPNVTHFTWCS